MSERSYRASPTKRLQRTGPRTARVLGGASQVRPSAAHRDWRGPQSHADRLMALAAAQTQTEVVVHGGRLLLVAAADQNKRFAVP